MSELICCACGCGRKLLKYHEKYNYERKYISGHNWRGKKRGPLSEERREILIESNLGKIISNEVREKLSKSHKGKIPWNRGKNAHKYLKVF